MLCLGGCYGALLLSAHPCGQAGSPASLALLSWQMEHVVLQVKEVRELRQRERENQQRDNALLRHRLAEEAQREAEAKVPCMFSSACLCNAL